MNVLAQMVLFALLADPASFQQSVVKIVFHGGHSQVLRSGSGLVVGSSDQSFFVATVAELFDGEDYTSIAVRFHPAIDRLARKAKSEVYWDAGLPHERRAPRSMFAILEVLGPKPSGVEVARLCRADQIGRIDSPVRTGLLMSSAHNASHWNRTRVKFESRRGRFLWFDHATERGESGSPLFVDNCVVALAVGTDGKQGYAVLLGALIDELRGREAISTVYVSDKENQRSRARRKLRLRHELDPTTDQKAYWQAVAEGNSALVRLFIEAGFGPDSKNQQGNGALHVAGENDDRHMINMLRRHGVRRDLQNADRETVWHILARRGSVDILSDLLPGGTSINARDACHRTPLMVALLHGQVKIARRFVQVNGVDINTRDLLGQAPLHVIVRSGASKESANAMPDRCRPLAPGQALPIELLDLLLQRPDVDVNAKDDTGMTPLHYAVDVGIPMSVSRLLQHPKTKINLTDAGGRTALHLAAGGPREDILVQVLNHAQVDASARDHYGDTPLHYAVRNPDEKKASENARAFLRAGRGNWCAPGHNGQTVLTGKSKIAELLHRPKCASTTAKIECREVP